MTLVLAEKQQELFTVAYNDYKKGLNSYAFFKVNNQIIGEDLVQDTFMKTWGYLVKGGRIEKMKAFLYHTLNNLIVDEYRKRKHKGASLDTLLEEGFEPGINDSERLFDTLDGKTAILL
jgi:DNA-directed RNA polymerase specialized sigma24 family protein